MRFKTRFVLAAGCIGLLGLSAPAFSLPKPKVPMPPARTSASKVPAKIGSKPQAKVHPDAKAAAKIKVAGTSKDRARTHATAHEHVQAPRAREERAMRLVSMPVSAEPKRPLLGWPVLVTEARKYIGTNPTARTKLWCATFMNMVLAKAGYAGTHSDAAKSFADYGHRINEPRVGAIAVLTRGKTGGHVGVVTGVDAQGNPIIISGNHGKRVGEGVYPRSRVIAYVMPSDDRPPITQLAARSQPGEHPAPTEGGLDSPISELIAAIEAEQTRDARPTRATAPALAAQARAPEPPVARAGSLPLDPAIADLLGLSQQVRDKHQPAAVTPAAPPQQRQRQVQQSDTLQPAKRLAAASF